MWLLNGRCMAFFKSQTHLLCGPGGTWRDDGLSYFLHFLGAFSDKHTLRNTNLHPVLRGIEDGYGSLLDLYLLFEIINTSLGLLTFSKCPKLYIYWLTSLLSFPIPLPFYFFLIHLDEEKSSVRIFQGNLRSGGSQASLMTTCKPYGACQANVRWPFKKLPVLCMNDPETRRPQTT